MFRVAFSHFRTTPRASAAHSRVRTQDGNSVGSPSSRLSPCNRLKDVRKGSPLNSRAPDNHLKKSYDGYSVGTPSTFRSKTSGRLNQRSHDGFSSLSPSPSRRRRQKNTEKPESHLPQMKVNFNAMEVDVVVADSHLSMARNLARKQVRR